MSGWLGARARRIWWRQSTVGFVGSRRARRFGACGVRRRLRNLTPMTPINPPAEVAPAARIAAVVMHAGHIVASNYRSQVRGSPIRRARPPETDNVPEQE